MNYFLTFDVGTTAVKTCLFAEDFSLLAIANDEYMLDTAPGGIVELEPETYWNAVCSGTRYVLEKSGADARNIAAISATTQGETLIPMGTDGKPLRKAIVWLDERAAAQADTLKEAVEDAEFYRMTGLPEINGFLPLAKLMWIRDNEPEVYEKTEKFLLLEDYLIFRLTGKLLTEKSLACSTGWYSFRDDGYWDAILDAAGIDREKLPEMKNPGEKAAIVCPEVQSLFGLSENVFVVTGAMDQVAGALGAGNCKPGIVTETTGTALAIGETIENPDFSDASRVTVYRHVKENMYLMIPFCMTAGLFLKWFKDQFCGEETKQAAETGCSVYELLSAQVEKAAPGAGGLIALPYLTGSIQPVNNPNARGVFFGFGIDTTKADFLRAVYESVAYMLRENLELLERVNGTKLKEVISLGGGAKSEIWLQIKSDVTKLPVGRTNQTESTSLGAAILAAVAVGSYESLEAAVSKATGEIHWKKPEEAAAYEKNYATYLELMQRVNPLF